MNATIDAHGVVSQSLEGPLAAYIGSFAKSVSEQGYSLDSVKRQTRAAAFFSGWLGRRSLRLCDVSAVQVGQFLRYRVRRSLSHVDGAAALSRLIDFLSGQNIIPAQRIHANSPTPAERCILSFEHYLREDRALAETSIVNYAPFIRRFLKGRFGNRQVTLSNLRAHDVVRFVQREAPRHPRQTKVMTSALRSFLRYARFRGDITLDLAAAVPAVANWRMTSIPRAISTDQVSRLLRSIDRTTAVGRRDYTIVLLLARLGVRASEVMFLALDDIDWHNGRVSVHGKGGRHSDLPLPIDVGDAMAAYLQDARPTSSSRRIFLCSRAPFHPLSDSTTVSTIVRRALMRADIHAPTNGTHQFRHGLATQMLRHGASLAEIGDVLGHRSVEATKIYTKVDIVALRALALPWPRGA